jgi:integrase
VTEQLSLSALAYRNFVDTCRTLATRRVYVKALRYFMDYLHLSPEAYDKLLDQDPKVTQMNICDYVSFLRKHKSPATVSAYVAAVRKFYSMNDIQLNWDKIHSFEGEKEKQAEDRPYTHSEIQTLIQKTSSRNRAIILLMASSGLRVGAVPLLRIRDLEPFDNFSIYKINVYTKSKKSRYFSFCSSECRKEIDAYLEWRKRWGERLQDDSPVFRKEYNTEGKIQVRPLTDKAIKSFMDVLLKDTGLRKVPLENQKYQRSHIMMCHGFRKFFETNAFKAGMDHMYLRRLMGQKSGLEDAYLKLSEEDLLEGDSRHIGYIGIIDQLTINEEHKLRREVETLRIEKSSLESLREEVDGLKALFSKG